ncbi:cytochrome P450 [Pyxidicoccus parkwayensis]|uniref:Cytochrome P450 n=1 Tax=Pyxidicoccus parkwayensis TaxID=2813578 RepID=A0ABX7P5M3_9BACT|nr:cytochrome P450 [Pyxidicoccus parkwaysis]QSQ25794.1 cytochrome P450 [Pyxidicoccus parkwaysis]
MAEREPAVLFEREPLRFLDEAFPAAGDAIWLPQRQLCLSDATASKNVLANGEGLYQDHSDFFRTRHGTFGPRPVQVRISRESRALLRTYLDARKDALEESVRRALVPGSEWPDAGNWLMYRHLAAALLSPDSPARLRQTVDAIVERAVLAGARERHSFLSRALFRFRVERELVRAVEQRRKRGTAEPADLLDVVVSAAGPEVAAEELAEVFLSFVFAAAGSVGFVLGWSVYLLGTNPPTDAEPAWVVKEALRLWPVAWLLGSRPAKRHEVAGVSVTPEDEVVVCPYAVQRNPRHWEDPSSFRPERWASVKNAQAFIPFGWGPHTCPAALLSMELVEDVLRLIVGGYRLTVTPRETRPHVTAALAPPRFALSLVSHRRDIPSMERR